MSLNRLNEAEQRATRKSSRWDVIAWAVLIASVVLVGWAAADEPSNPHAINPPDAVIWVQVGGTSPDNSIRRIGGGIVKRGWMASWQRRKTDEAIDLCDEHGLKAAVMIHNPFGDTPRWPMDYGQSILLDENPELWRVKEDFRLFLDHLRSRGVQVNVYLGCLSHDQDFVPIEDDAQAWIERATLATREIPSWVGIGFDRLHDTDEMEPATHWVRLQASLGRRVWVEPRHAADSALLGFPSISSASHWVRSDPDRHGDAKAKGWATNAASSAQVTMLFTLGNNPEKINKGLGVAIDQGLLPAFPAQTAATSVPFIHSKIRKAK